MVLKYAKAIIDQESAALKKLSSSLSSTFTESVEIISSVKGKVIISGVGKSGFVGKKIASTLNSVGVPSSFIHPTEASHGDLGLITKQDILIILSKSGKSKELYDLSNFATLKKIPTILISSSRLSKLVKQSTLVINIPNVEEAGENKLAPTTSTTMMLSLGDALALSASKKKKFSTKDFGKLHPGGNIGAKFITVNEIMHKLPQVPLARKSTNMKDIILKMSQKGFGCVGIIDDKKVLLGVITDGDLRRNMKDNILSKKAEEIMTKKPKIIAKDNYIKDAIKIFYKEKITVLFVSENKISKIPIGIIHLHDCFLKD
tara:strand:- start:7861 stop:8811 length:951 start_codon:yes stop_codon:yes gene_type:complete